MSKYRQLIYSWLEKQKEKEQANIESNKKSNETSDSINKGDNLSKKISPQKKKKIIWSIITVLVAGGILAVILATTLSPKPITVSQVTSITKETLEDNDNKITIKYKVKNSKNAEEAILDLTDAYAVWNNGGMSAILYAKDTNSNDVLAIRIYYLDKTGTQLQLGGIDIPSASNAPAPTDASKLNEIFLFSSFPQTFDWLSLISLLIPIIMIIIIIIIFIKLRKSQGGLTGTDSIFSIGKSTAKLAKSDVKFSDVAGIDEEKEELIEIVDYLKNPQKYVAMGARSPKGVILYGPPGTGKTLLAKAVAGEAGVPFFESSGSQFDDMLVGVGAKRVKDLFAKARKAAPAIIFIDEIDSVASKRGKNDFNGGSGVADQTINQLLAELDGFNTSSGIVVIAATNRLETLDDAILRPGRFDRHIQVNLPDIKGREEILKIHARNKNISKKVSFYDVARRTPGLSGAQLENVLNEATLLAVRKEDTIITNEHIDEAIDRVMAGLAKKNRTSTLEERKMIAYHEAGHAVVGLYTANTDIVEKITIIPRGRAAGYTLQTPVGAEKIVNTKSDLISMIRSLLGGRAAEEVVFGSNSITTGASNDLYKVTEIAKSMVTKLGMTKVGMTQFIPTEGQQNPYVKFFSEETNKNIDKAIEEIIQKEYLYAKDIIKKHRKEVDLIVETLVLVETIMREDIEYIHKNKKLPQVALDAKDRLAKEKIELKKKSSKKPSNDLKDDKDPTNN